MKCVSIPEARRLANATGATRLMILGIDDAGNFALTTYGRTKSQCEALRKWADRNAPDIALSMEEGFDL
jgi:hypothetical protein